MASLFKQTTTYDPIFSLLNAEKEEERDRLTQKWKENKIEELNFVGIVGALLAGVLTSTGDWPRILPNGTRSPWTVRACWYCGLIIALASVVTAAQQAIRLHRLACHQQHAKCIRRLLASNRTNDAGSILPRRLQVFAWQMSGWLLMVSALCMLAGMLILIWSSTLTKSQRKRANWWNEDAKLAVTFTIITTILFGLGFIQQFTLYTWDGQDDGDQRHLHKMAVHESDSAPWQEHNHSKSGNEMSTSIKTAATTASSGEPKAHQEDETFFFRLPPELRNYVYELAIVTDCPRFLWRGRYAEALQPALTRTSKVIRSESLPIFYSKNKFVIGVNYSPDSSEFQNAVSWLRTIGETSQKDIQAVLVLHVEWDYPHGRRLSGQLGRMLSKYRPHLQA